MDRRRKAALFLFCVLAFAGCSPARDPSFVVSFSQTPLPTVARLPSPPANSPHPTRLASSRLRTPAAADALSSGGGLVRPTEEASPVSRSPLLSAATAAPVETLAPPGPAGDGRPSQVDQGITATFTPTAALIPRPAAIDPPSPAPTLILSATPVVATASPPLVGTSPSAMAASATSAPAPGPTVTGQVSEADGQFVTSNSRSARFYYAVDDPSWHRIHADHRVWFGSVGDLLVAFPDRVEHTGRTRRSTRTVTPTPSS